MTVLHYQHDFAMINTSLPLYYQHEFIIAKRSLSLSRRVCHNQHEIAIIKTNLPLSTRDCHYQHQARRHGGPKGAGPPYWVRCPPTVILGYFGAPLPGCHPRPRRHEVGVDSKLSILGHLTTLVPGK
jgi:hypothetical protein